MPLVTVHALTHHVIEVYRHNYFVSVIHVEQTAFGFLFQLNLMVTIHIV